jgi:hypothetical protein
MRTVAIIGMPRSGSTIVASYINSMPGVFIVGEPFLAANSPRPMGKLWPTIADTDYGEPLIIHQDRPVFPTIMEFVNKIGGINMVGFKECWTPWTDPITIVEDLGIHTVLVTIREPPKNYMSMYERRPPDTPPFSVRKFNAEYVRFCDFPRSYPVARAVFLDDFRLNPKREIERATGWDLPDHHKFTHFTGGGDESARVATKVKKRDTRTPYNGNDIVQSVKTYNGMRPWKQ